MSGFKREERYVTIKLKPLDDVDIHHLRAYLVEHNIGTVDCVVVEADWPEYEPVWEMIEKRVLLQAMTPSELSAAGCTCVRYGKNNPHWPCPMHII